MILVEGLKMRAPQAEKLAPVSILSLLLCSQHLDHDHKMTLFQVHHLFKLKLTTAGSKNFCPPLWLWREIQNWKHRTYSLRDQVSASRCLASKLVLCKHGAIWILWIFGMLSVSVYGVPPFWETNRPKRWISVQARQRSLLQGQRGPNRHVTSGSLVPEHFKCGPYGAIVVWKNEIYGQYGIYGMCIFGSNLWTQ